MIQKKHTAALTLCWFVMALAGPTIATPQSPPPPPPPTLILETKIYEDGGVEEPADKAPRVVVLANTEINDAGSLDKTFADGGFTCGSPPCTAYLSDDTLEVRDQCANDGLVSQFPLDVDPATPTDLIQPDYVCGTDCVQPRLGADAADFGIGNTWAARSAYYWAQQAVAVATRHIAASDIPDIAIETNHREEQQQLSCTGLWNKDTSTIKLYQSTLGCANTGEVPGIVIHEWGHGLYQNLYSGPQGSIDPVINEAQADVLSALVLRDGCIGRGTLFSKKCHGCRDSCNGLRDLEGFSLKSNQPAHQDILFNTGDPLPDGLACPPDLGVVGPLGAESHCESQIASTAFWDLSQFLVDRYGVPGWDKAEELLLKSLPLVRYAYSISSPGNVDGCGAHSWYNVLRNLDIQATGGLHGCEIFRAFDAHGIACPNPLASSCPAWAYAGSDREVCVGQEIEIGPAVAPSTPFSWNTGETSQRIQVAPTNPGISTYTLTTYPPGTKPSPSASTPSFSDEVQVRAHQCLSFFSEDFDPPLDDFSSTMEGWQTSGLWHHLGVGDSCPLIPPGGMFFGVDRVCSFETCHTTYGDLVSPPILVEDPTHPGDIPVLIFDGQREVEYDPQPISSDTAEVWVREWNVPGGFNELRWAKSSAQRSFRTRTEAATISLDRYVGSTIQLVFKFDTKDQYYNQYYGWRINNVTVSAEQTPDSWAPPSSFDIVNPVAGQELPCCECATFEVQVEDYEGTDISDQVVWTLNGTTEIGSGRGMQTILPPTPPGETHKITASVIDRMGKTVEKSLLVAVPDNGLECEILSMSPAEVIRLCASKRRRVD